jgi:O-antigen biosynthesis alpha-1,3-mannosyltransferase
MLDRKKTGVGYYISHLASSLQHNYRQELDLTGYYFNFLSRNKNDLDQYKTLKFHKISLIPGKILSVCRSLGFQPYLEIFVRQKSDAVIFTNFVSLPQLQKTKTALIVYDLSFLDVPQYSQEKNLAYLRRFCGPSIKRADVIITISEFTKKRIEHYFPDLNSKIVVTPIPPAADISITSTGLSPRLITSGVAAGKYILYLGTVEPRKNIQNLVLAYQQLEPAIQKKHPLVIAGGKGWKDGNIWSAINTARSKGANIVMTGYITDDEKSALYSNAACFVLPSHYEGFGMPLLEAMQYGIPTAASDIEVFHELADDATLYFDKDNPQDIAQKLLRLLSDKKLCHLLSKKGQSRVESFSWQANAEAVYEALQD